MAYTSKLFLLTALLVLTMSFVVSTSRSSNYPTGRKSNLAARLNLDEESSTCWESLFQLQACSKEVVLFFLNGETYLGDGCCKAIRTIEHQCWPALLGSLGLTTEETDILKGYCDEADQIQSPPTSPSPPSVHQPTGKLVPDLDKLIP
ncbi:egg cell-secreted protein 1.3-like [Rosa rugosa]|uniref:Putative Prolamin-like domain-containing protein n=1 Tax=Rosa chinensis TaxID=74649 RepID=A0A2P6PUC2_ROSCH|nr:egg cell-secreted protein 1.3 [Rosa chinensis]XP_062019389.1 egg cell-secreted protein 1.3-like [Rosa rugosa]PRQ25531.1 putative Prolamin-like domain-containing protein [Rosa chinensis]